MGGALGDVLACHEDEIARCPRNLLRVEQQINHAAQALLRFGPPVPVCRPMGPPFCRVMGPGKRIEQPKVRLPRNGLRVEGWKSLFRTTPGSEVLQGHGATGALGAVARGLPRRQRWVMVGDVLALEDGAAAWQREHPAAGPSHRELP